jgi:hypothetical protein
VVELSEEARRAGGLRLQLYLPEEGLTEANPAVQVHLEPWTKPQQVALKPGLNRIELHPNMDAAPCLVLTIYGGPLVKPPNPQDQRQLLAVLNDLETVGTAEGG